MTPDEELTLSRTIEDILVARNPRGMKSKSLRGSDAEGWASASRARAASASVITYTENWSIEGMPDRPVFRSRSDTELAPSPNAPGRRPQQPA